ncbi:MAG: transcriptional regulator GcvA [Pseudomonadota bacterium]
MTRLNIAPLRGLQAFEAAARHLSFAKAADELNVTPGAVSHQIRALEDWLGAPLFHRLTRALRLTDAGLDAAPILSDGFDRLAEATRRMTSRGADDVLTLSVSPGFGSLWLVPRLDDFRRRHPDIEVRIDGTDRLVDVTRGEADVAIRYGRGGYADVQCDRLFAMRATPVCSPAILAGSVPLKTPDDLKNHTLLHIEWKEAEGSWRTWLLAAGAVDVDPFKGPRFTKEEMAVRAALDGEGIALIGDHMAADHIASGRLVRPFTADLSTQLIFAYFLLSPRDRLTEPKISQFRNWLLDAAKRTEGAGPSHSHA